MSSDHAHINKKMALIVDFFCKWISIKDADNHVVWLGCLSNRCGIGLYLLDKPIKGIKYKLEMSVYQCAQQQSCAVFYN